MIEIRNKKYLLGNCQLKMLYLFNEKIYKYLIVGSYDKTIKVHYSIIICILFCRMVYRYTILKLHNQKH